MIDPIGKQKRIPSHEMRVFEQKILDGGGAKAKYGGQRNMESGTHKASFARNYKEWQGKEKGGTKHTYGVGGKNRGHKLEEA